MQQIAPITAKIPVAAPDVGRCACPRHALKVNTGVILLASFGRNTPSRHVTQKMPIVKRFSDVGLRVD